MTAPLVSPISGAIALNRNCYCFPIERRAIDSTILSHSADVRMRKLLAERENYFASTAIFLTENDIQTMTNQIAAIEQVFELEAYQQVIKQRQNNSLFAAQPATHGVFMGYDFHMTPEGPRLIEINSNAGGAFIVNALEQAIRKPNINTGASIKAMFEAEWRSAGRTKPLKTIAIVDENPEAQFHYPDMCLAAAMLRGQGYTVIVTDPLDLEIHDGVLRVGETSIDLVYNRLTDFMLDKLYNGLLRRALEQDMAVITPNPRHHALFADKRNLALLSDSKFLDELNVSEPIKNALSLIPETIIVTSDAAAELWSQRRQYFFKPQAGFGSRAAYRGAKLTKKVWSHILKGGYVAQRFISPPLRAVTSDTEKLELKFDVRVYTYNGEPLLLAARVYQGQTTNLRTKGGGLAPVISIGDDPKINCT